MSMDAHLKRTRWNPFAAFLVNEHDNRRAKPHADNLLQPSIIFVARHIFRESRLVFLLILDLRSTVLLFRFVFFHTRSLGIGTSVVVFGISRDVVEEFVFLLGVLGAGLASFGHAAREDLLTFGVVLAGWRGGGALGGGGLGLGSGWFFVSL